VKLTIHSHLVSSSRIRESVHPLPYTSTWLSALLVKHIVSFNDISIFSYMIKNHTVYSSPFRYIYKIFETIFTLNKRYLNYFYSSSSVPTDFIPRLNENKPSSSNTFRAKRNKYLHPVQMGAPLACIQTEILTLLTLNQQLECLSSYSRNF
jgi:hypothetical protein